MATHTIKREYPEVSIGKIDGYGRNLGPRSRGTMVELFFRDGVPWMAEVSDIKTGGDDHYAHVGLSVENGSLVGYDGVFDIPEQILEMLEDLGIRNGLYD